MARVYMQGCRRDTVSSVSKLCISFHIKPGAPSIIKSRSLNSYRTECNIANITIARALCFKFLCITRAENFFHRCIGIIIKRTRVVFPKEPFHTRAQNILYIRRVKIKHIHYKRILNAPGLHRANTLSRVITAR